jgi:hypothetical protein
VATQDKKHRQLKNFKTRLLGKGYTVVMYSENDNPKEIKISLPNEGDPEISLLLFRSTEQPSPTSEQLYNIEVKNCMVRRATDPDPENSFYAGSKILRDNLRPQEAMKAFVVTSTNESSKVEFSMMALSEYECAEIVQGLALMIAEKRSNSIKNDSLLAT